MLRNLLRNPLRDLFRSPLLAVALLLSGRPVPKLSARHAGCAAQRTGPALLRSRGEFPSCGISSADHQKADALYRKAVNWRATASSSRRWNKLQAALRHLSARHRLRHRRAGRPPEGRRQPVAPGKPGDRRRATRSRRWPPIAARRNSTRPTSTPRSACMTSCPCRTRPSYLGIAALRHWAKFTWRRRPECMTSSSADRPLPRLKNSPRCSASPPFPTQGSQRPERSHHPRQRRLGDRLADLLQKAGKILHGPAHRAPGTARQRHRGKPQQPYRHEPAHLLRPGRNHAPATHRPHQRPACPLRSALRHRRPLPGLHRRPRSRSQPSMPSPVFSTICGTTSQPSCWRSRSSRSQPFSPRTSGSRRPISSRSSTYTSEINSPDQQQRLSADSRRPDSQRPDRHPRHHPGRAAGHRIDFQQPARPALCHLRRRIDAERSHRGRRPTRTSTAPIRWPVPWTRFCCAPSTETPPP